MRLPQASDSLEPASGARGLHPASPGCDRLVGHVKRGPRSYLLGNRIPDSGGRQGVHRRRTVEAHLDIPTIAVTPGNIVGISFGDPQVAGATWMPSVGQQPLAEEPSTTATTDSHHPNVKTPPGDTYSPSPRAARRPIESRVVVVSDRWSPPTRNPRRGAFSGGTRPAQKMNIHVYPMAKWVELRRMSTRTTRFTCRSVHRRERGNHRDLGRHCSTTRHRRAVAQPPVVPTLDRPGQARSCRNSPIPTRPRSADRRHLTTIQ